MDNDAVRRSAESPGVPGHQVVTLAPRQHRYCVCIFVLNEGARFLAQLDRMSAISASVDIVVADGGSTDGSVARHNLESRGVRALLIKDAPPGLGAQMRMGFAYALREGYDGVITIDGNNKDDPGAVPAFAQLLDEGYDHVQGSRFIAGGRHRNTPASRIWALRLIHRPMMRWASGFPYTDTTNGFRAYSRALLSDPRVALFRDVFRGYELHYYLAIRAARLGFRVCEVGVTREYPDGGHVPTKISPLKGNLRVLRALIATCLGRFDPPSPASKAAPEGQD